MTVAEGFDRTIQLFLVDGAATAFHKASYRDRQLVHTAKEEARHG